MHAPTAPSRSRRTRPTIVFGGVVHNDDTWIRQAYDAGAKGCFDAMATHPYVGPANASPTAGGDKDPWDFEHLDAVHKLMISKGDDKPIWATEFGWSSHPNTGNEASWNLGVTEAQQADYTVSALQLLEDQFPLRHPRVHLQRPREGDVQPPAERLRDHAIGSESEACLPRRPGLAVDALTVPRSSLVEGQDQLGTTVRRPFV